MIALWLQLKVTLDLGSVPWKLSSILPVILLYAKIPLSLDRQLTKWLIVMLPYHFKPLRYKTVK
ncbi:unnamed protein product, partial [Vitis vinifera]